LRLCYIASGISIHTERWVNYFARRGDEVHLISSRFTEGYEGFDSRIQMHPLVRLLPQIWKLSGYLSGILWLFQVRRLVQRIRPDILDAHYIGVPAYLAVASGFHPLVLSAWGSDILIDAKRNPLRRILTQSALKKAEMVICDSETARKRLLELGTRPDKITKIFWGVDTQQFNPQRRDEELKGNLGVSGAPTIICVRNLKPVYNVEMLIRAIPLILEQTPQARFILAGDGEQRGYLKSLASSLGVLDSIKFVGLIPHNELPKYLASSDIYVSTSLSDSTSLSLQEAMACELAPVVTDLPANREWIVDGENGFIVPINDVRRLADKIGYLIENVEVRRKLGRPGRSIIEEEAEYEKNMKKMENVYEQLVRSKNRLEG